MKPSAQPFLWKSVAILARHMLWFNFILGLNFIFLFFKFIIIHYHTQKQRKTIVEISFICLRKKNPFHTKGWAPNLVLIQRPGGTQKWPIHFFSVVFVAVKFDWLDRSFFSVPNMVPRRWIFKSIGKKYICELHVSTPFEFLVCIKYWSSGMLSTTRPLFLPCFLSCVVCFGLFWFWLFFVGFTFAPLDCKLVVGFSHLYYAGFILYVTFVLPIFTQMIARQQQQPHR